MQPAPRVIRRTKTGIAIDWADGHHSEYTYGFLRKRCPCAECRQSPPRVVEGDDPLRLIDDLPIRAEGASLVGHYAVQFVWNDGHQHGIYSFEYLRSLCECPACRGSQA